jgi:hypothetical protein
MLFAVSQSPDQLFDGLDLITFGLELGDPKGLLR